MQGRQGARSDPLTDVPGSTWWASGVASVVCAASVALLGGEIVSYSRNTLLNHPEWVSGKLLLVHGAMGSLEGAGTRNLLARNRINLHEWFGNNELLLNRVFAFGSLELSFRLDDGAYLTILFNRTARSFSGVRLSRRPSRPSVYVRAGDEGEILERRLLDTPVIGPGWHRIALRTRDRGVEIDLDGQFVDRLPVEPLPKQVVGFRGSQRAAVVDDVVVTDGQGGLVIEESFRNDHPIWQLRLILFLGALALLGAIVTLARLGGLGDRAFLFRFVLGAYLVVFALGLYLCVDFFIWSSRYPFRGHTPWRRGYELSAVEQLRRAVFHPFRRLDSHDERGVVLTLRGISSSYPELRRFLGTANQLYGYAVEVAGGIVEPYRRIQFDEDVLRSYFRERPLGSTYTILLLGTSQTAGEGATRRDESMAARIQAALTARSGSPVTVVNAAIKGSHSHELLRRFQIELAPVSPNLVVLNLSHNDHIPRFGHGLRGLVRESRERGARVLFVLEAYGLENDAGHLPTKHGIMRRVGARLAIPVVDLYAHVAERERNDAGFIWWDPVHLTSFGHALAAESIAAGIWEHFGGQIRRYVPEAGPDSGRRDARERDLAHANP